MKKLNKKGVFGLTAVQAFFATVLSIALLAYIIVVIMGTLQDASLLNSATNTVTNETIAPTTAGTALAANSNDGCSATITQVLNGSFGKVIAAGNYSVTGCTLKNLTSDYIWAETTTQWNVSYTYTYNTVHQKGLTGILTNTSSGVTGFFKSVDPVYAILAVLVIILVLVVLVRVVQ